MAPVIGRKATKVAAKKKVGVTGMQCVPLVLDGLPRCADTILIYRDMSVGRGLHN